MPSVKPRRWFVPRYSLRTLLIAVTVVCVVSGYWLNKAFRQREAVRRFHQLRASANGDELATMLYRHEGYIDVEPYVHEHLHYLRDLIGIEAFGDPIGVQLLDTAATDDDLRHLHYVPNLERVWLSKTKVTDKGMGFLRACPKLNFLNLDNTAVTDAGLADICRLTELNSLSLSGTKITDEGLEHLAKLTTLRKLWLGNTAITDAGYRKLRAALPQCEIHVGAVHR